MIFTQEQYVQLVAAGLQGAMSNPALTSGIVEPWEVTQLMDKIASGVQGYIAVHGLTVEETSETEDAK